MDLYFEHVASRKVLFSLELKDLLQKEFGLLLELVLFIWASVGFLPKVFHNQRVHVLIGLDSLQSIIVGSHRKLGEQKHQLPDVKIYRFYQFSCLVQLHSPKQRPHRIHLQLLNLLLVIGPHVLNQQR